MNTFQFCPCQKKTVLAMVSYGLLLGSTSLPAAVIFDTITGASSVGSEPVGYYGTVGETQYYERYAERFTPGPGYTQITEVKMRLLDFDSTGGDYNVHLYEQLGGKPDNSRTTFVGSGSITALGSSPVTVTFPVSISVTPETPYWIVLSTVAATPPDVVDWSYTDTSSNPSVGADAFTYFDGTSWAALSTGVNHQQMQISAVPEPSAYLLVASFGLFGFALWNRRRTLRA